MLKKDSHAKVKMRTKVRGLRAIEREVLTQQKQQEQQPQEQQPQEPAQATEKSSAEATGALPSSRASSSREQADIVLEYCAAVRGILNDDQGGPLHPPSLRMAEALNEVQESLQRNLEAKKGGPQKVNCGG